MERGRKTSAPTVDLVAYLPTLSLPLQGGDLGPTVSAETSVSTTNKARRLPLRLSPGEGRKRGVERSRRRVNLSISSPLPVLLPLEKGLRPDRFGRDERLRNKQSTPLALASLPWGGERKGRPEGGHPVERGRKEPAPTVDTVAHLPTLSLPLQGGDSTPNP